jgi:cell wall-associated NlpC family hydrolase
MGAAGVEGAENRWMRQPPFEDWLSINCRRGGTDDAPGTVMVWRSPAGLALHAAITIGDGWALHKVSQGWMSPTKILSTADIKRSARDVGRRLVRYTIAR